AAARLPSATNPGLYADATAFQVGDLMPGDALPTETIPFSVTGNTTYTVQSRTTGSRRLAQALLIVISSQRSGAVLYRGSLAGAVIAGGLGARLAARYDHGGDLHCDRRAARKGWKRAERQPPRSR